jgi:hypothetical protein
MTPYPTNEQGSECGLCKRQVMQILQLSSMNCGMNCVRGSEYGAHICGRSPANCGGRSGIEITFSRSSNTVSIVRDHDCPVLVEAALARAFGSSAVSARVVGVLGHEGKLPQEAP